MNIFIDGIDDEKINKSSFNIKENNVFLNQISKTGRSFDSGLLIKKDVISEEATHDLILFQDSINKLINYQKRINILKIHIKVKFS